MKAKKNIIKKISQFNSFNLKHRKELKHWIRAKNFKYKNFNIILSSSKNLKLVYKINKYYKYSIVKILSLLRINKNIYFNYITNGLNLKYDDQLVQFSEKNNFIINFDLKKTIYANYELININSIQKLCVIYDGKFMYKNKIILTTNDIVDSNIYISMCIINEIYLLLIKILILKLIKNILKKL